MFAQVVVATLGLAAGFRTDDRPRVLVTGATGRTGSLLYAKLKASPAIAEVRAFVSNLTKAKLVLKCNRCDSSEGIYQGNVTMIDTLMPAAEGMDTIAIVTGSPYTASAQLQKAIEFGGVQNTAAALGVNAAVIGLDRLRVVMCSSMGTTDPSPSPSEGGTVLFWKLNAEAFLAASGIGSVIVKPCGLVDSKDNATLLVGHDDTLLATSPPIISRDNVAQVMAAAVESRAKDLRFDLCSKPGPSTADLPALLKEAKYSWQKTYL